MGIYQVGGMGGRSVHTINASNKLGVSHEAFIKETQISNTFNDQGYVGSILEGSFEAVSSLLP